MAVKKPTPIDEEVAAALAAARPEFESEATPAADGPDVVTPPARPIKGEDLRSTFASRARLVAASKVVGSADGKSGG